MGQNNKQTLQFILILHTYIYIYIRKERDREREKNPDNPLQINILTSIIYPHVTCWIKPIIYFPIFRIHS